MPVLKKLILASVAVLLPLSASLPAQADALDDIIKAKVLKVAVPQDFPPFGSVGTDMQPRGYDIDAAALIAKELGVKLELVPVSSANRLPYLQTKKVDLVISSLGKNPDREKQIDFTVAYAPFYSGVFGAASVKVSAVGDLSKKSVGVTRGALEDLELSKIVPADADVRRFEDNNTTIAAVLSGQEQLIATGNVVAAAILEKNPPIRPEPKFVIKDSPCYIGLNKDEPALLAKVNGIIAKARKDGSLDAISKKWLGAPIPADLPG